jgi:hypothetical protein
LSKRTPSPWGTSNIHRPSITSIAAGPQPRIPTCHMAWIAVARFAGTLKTLSGRRNLVTARRPQHSLHCLRIHWASDDGALPLYCPLWETIEAMNKREWTRCSSAAESWIYTWRCLALPRLRIPCIVNGAYRAEYSTHGHTGTRAHAVTSASSPRTPG